MELRMIKGITSKGQGDPSGITMEDGKAWTNFLLTKELVTEETTWSRNMIASSTTFLHGAEHLHKILATDDLAITSHLLL
ncbi:hypothetical protein Tco_1409817 [Tanacetum coccineum]